MPFIKGQSGNPAGRPVGKKCTKAANLRSHLIAFLTEKLPELRTEFSALAVQEKVSFVGMLLPYALPQVHHIQSENLVKENQCQTQNTEDIENLS